MRVMLMLKTLKSCYLKLSSGYKVRIDQEDREKIEARSWRVTKGASGRLRVVTSQRIDGKVKTTTLGKFLMNPRKGKQVYPRRFNEELDYRKTNLIVCTMKEMQRLLPKKRIKTSSIYRGVSFGKKVKKWRAAIEVNGRTFNLGDFKTEVEAAKAYNVASKKSFGELGYQNPVSRKKAPRT